MKNLLKVIVLTVLCLISVNSFAGNIKTEKNYIMIDRMIKHQGIHSTMKRIVQVGNGIKGTRIDAFTTRGGLSLKGILLINVVILDKLGFEKVYNLSLENKDILKGFDSFETNVACSNPAQRALLDNGIVLQQITIDTLGNFINKTEITKLDCI